MSLWAMLKLPTSLFECICFICVNIVSFSSLWGCCPPRLFITAFSQANLQQAQIQNVPEKTNEDCVSMQMYFLYFVFSSFFRLMDWSLLGFYFCIYSTLWFLSEVEYAIWHWFSNPESLNCAFGLPYSKISSLCNHSKWS